MEYKIFILGKDSYIQADDVADHQNDIGREKNDREIVCIGEDANDKGIEGLRPIRYLARANDKEIMAEIEAEFESEVEIYFGTKSAAESYSSLKCK